MANDYLYDYKHQLLFKRFGPLLTSQQYRDLKDPCPVFDGTEWHIFGSGGTVVSEDWEIFHATAPSITGPWKEVAPTTLVGVEGPAMAAPGVVFDGEKMHMFIQTNCFGLGGKIEHLTAKHGTFFYKIDTALDSIANSEESGIYDPHPAVINNQKYLAYSGMSQVGRPEIFLAKSTHNTWYGPWQRLGKILTHTQVDHHNQLDFPHYEWGLEGAQLLELPNSKILLNAVCFLPKQSRGTKQRIFFAIADAVEGPYKTLGPLLDPQLDHWGSAENGHAAAIIANDRLHLMYQARHNNGEAGWNYGLAQCDIPALLQHLQLTPSS